MNCLSKRTVLPGMTIIAMTLFSACGDGAPPTSPDRPVVPQTSGNLETDKLAATLAQDAAFINSGLTQEDALAICRLMITGDQNDFSNERTEVVFDTVTNQHKVITHVMGNHKMLGPASDKRILSVEVAPGGDTVHVMTGEVRGPLAGNGDDLVFIRKLGKWRMFEHSWWIS